MKSAYSGPPGAPSAGTGQFMSPYAAGAAAAGANANTNVGPTAGPAAGALPSGRSRIVSAAELAWLQVGTRGRRRTKRTSDSCSPL